MVKRFGGGIAIAIATRSGGCGAPVEAGVGENKKKLERALVGDPLPWTQWRVTQGKREAGVYLHGRGDPSFPRKDFCAKIERQLG